MTKYKSFEEWWKSQDELSNIIVTCAREAWHARDVEIEALKAQNEKLVEALKFYAESSRSLITADFHSAKEAIDGSLQLVYTFGKRARETLKELGLIKD